MKSKNLNGPTAWVVLCALLCEVMPLWSLRAADVPKVENVVARVEGEKVVVTYDLVGSADETYVVGIRLLRKSSTAFEYTPGLGILGDIGEGQRAGRDKRILWAYTQEFKDGLGGDDFFFEIQAQVVSGGISFWWFAGGAAIVGGALAILLAKKTETPPQQDQFPDEPGRPQ